MTAYIRMRILYPSAIVLLALLVLSVPTVNKLVICNLTIKAVYRSILHRDLLYTDTLGGMSPMS